MAQVGGYLAEFRQVFLKWIPSTCGCAATGRGLYIYYIVPISPPIKPNNKLSNVILGLSIQSIIQHTPMSLSSDSVALRRKRTATERALNNADPLIIKKKAHQAGVTHSKSNPPNNSPIVSHFFMLLNIS